MTEYTSHERALIAELEGEAKLAKLIEEHQQMLCDMHWAGYAITIYEEYV